jgi:hypothetical protein
MWRWQQTGSMAAGCSCRCSKGAPFRRARNSTAAELLDLLPHLASILEWIIDEEDEARSICQQHALVGVGCAAAAAPARVDVMAR